MYVRRLFSTCSQSDAEVCRWLENFPMTRVYSVIASACDVRTRLDGEVDVGVAGCCC